MNRFMQGYYPVKDVSPLHECILRGLHYMINHQIQPNSYGFCENLEANVKETDMSVLLDPFCFINLRQTNYLTEIKEK
jgi:hypothetical protein